MNHTKCSELKKKEIKQPFREVQDKGIEHRK